MGCILEISYKAQWLSNHIGNKQFGVLQRCWNADIYNLDEF